MKFSIRLTLLATMLFSLQVADAQENTDLYILAGKLFDSEQAELQSKQIIHISGNRITAVASELEIPDSARVIDLSDYTVLPGLIDAHTHLLYLESPKGDLATEGIKAVVTEGDALRALRGAARAKTFLEAGITTVKDLGNSGQYLDVALKQAIQEGSVPGPRMFVSGPIISSEGGQMPGLLKTHRHIAELEYRVVRGVEDAISAVRENVTYGADVIKICANNTPNNTSLTMDEMAAIVKTAHRYRRKVTAHATNNLAVWEAVMSGVDGIEHGYQIEDTTLALMAEKGVRLIPTDISRSELYKYLELSGFEGDIEQAVAGYQQAMHGRFQRAVDHGVRIIAGSDNYIDFEKPQGEAAKQVLIAYHEAGMPALEVLRAATYHSAQFMERENALGILKPGALADIIALKGDIEHHFAESLFDVVFVMKDGKIYVEEE